MTHINITKHNQLYFQTGRATRGMLVIMSDDADDKVAKGVQQQFQAAINSVENAWRMPIFTIGQNDKVQWQPIDNSSRDMEFQYLTDMNARVIFSAFQMSPDELPGWTHLSRGTTNQSLSESNNEYRLEAARDLGIRPLLSDFEDFINASLFPLIDPQLAKLCRVRLLGLDAETAEKESVRIQQDMQLHMTYNQILEKVEKNPVKKEFGGDYPLNPQFQQIVTSFKTQGEILEEFFGVEGASKDPNWAYVANPFWFQWQQLKMEQQQMAQAQQQAAQQPPGGGDGSKGPPGQGGGGQDQGGDAVPKVEPGAQNDEDLTRSVDQAIGVLTKGEKDLPPSKRRLLEHYRHVLKQAIEPWEEDVAEATKSIVDVAARYSRKKN
jgi:hypothetical protein